MSEEEKEANGRGNEGRMMENIKKIKKRRRKNSENNLIITLCMYVCMHSS